MKDSLSELPKLTFTVDFAKTLLQKGLNKAHTALRGYQEDHRKSSTIYIESIVQQLDIRLRLLASSNEFANSKKIVWPHALSIIPTTS
jgi:hypothetical protein